MPLMEVILVTRRKEEGGETEGGGGTEAVAHCPYIEESDPVQLDGKRGRG